MMEMKKEDDEFLSAGICNNEATVDHGRLKHKLAWPRSTNPPCNELSRRRNVTMLCTPQ